jgi:hypothetical protein
MFEYLVLGSGKTLAAVLIFCFWVGMKFKVGIMQSLE